MREQLTVKAVAIFFLPLILMMELHQISHSVIQAFLARLTDPLVVLAGFSLAFTLCNMVGCLSQSAIQAGISFISDRGSFWRLVKFYAVIGLFPFALLQTIAQTRLGDIIFGEWIGASAAVISEAKTASGILTLWIYPIMARNIAFSLAFIQKRTILITYATVVRLLSLFIFLFIYPFWLKGAAIGSAALVSCMAAEGAFMAVVTYPYFSKLPRDNGVPVPYLDMWRFSWPLMIAQVTENGVAFIINIFLGHLSNPDLAIAGFGVSYAIVRAILAPLKSLVQTAQTLLRSREDLVVLLKFTAWLQLAFVGIIFGLFYTPMRISVLDGIMGLTLELRDYVTPGLRLTFLVAVFWAFSSLFRGMLSAVRSTFAIAVTAFIRLVVIAVVGSAAFLWPDLNGSVIGIVAMSCAFLSESLVLGRQLYIRFKQAAPWSVSPTTGEAAG
jgi:progressive ankylosis protein